MERLYKFGVKPIFQEENLLILRHHDQYGTGEIHIRGGGASL